MVTFRQQTAEFGAMKIHGHLDGLGVLESFRASQAGNIQKFQDELDVASLREGKNALLFQRIPKDPGPKSGDLLLYRGWNTTQLYRDLNKPLQGSL